MSALDKALSAEFANYANRMHNEAEDDDRVRKAARAELQSLRERAAAVERLRHRLNLCAETFARVGPMLRDLASEFTNPDDIRDYAEAASECEWQVTAASSVLSALSAAGEGKT